MLKLVLSFLGGLFGALFAALRRAEQDEIMEDKQNAQNFEDTLEATEARNSVQPGAAGRDKLLDEILIRTDADEQEIVLPQLPSGVPARHGSSGNGSGSVRQLRSLEEIVYPFSAGSLKHLGTCDIKLQWLVREMAMFYDITVVCGTRSMKDQQEAYDNGRSRTKPGYSKHNSLPSQAVDFVPADAPAMWKKKKDLPRARYDEVAAKALEIARMGKINLRWGGDWDQDGDLFDQSFNDLGHFELVDA